MNINALRQKWTDNAEEYKTVEVGGGVQDFIKDILSYPELFGLKGTPQKTGKSSTFVRDTEKGKHGKPDFILYVNKNVTMPCEAKCYTRIEEGVKQLQGYRSDYTKEYGILTDGYTWRLYRSNSYETWTLDQMLDNPKLFRTFWENYLTPENYYTEIFQPSSQQILFEEPINLNDTENRKIFFKETRQLILKFRTKIKIEDNKTALETAYAYLIQFILYKSLVDSRFTRFESEYTRFKQQIVKAIRDNDLYNLVIFQIRNVSEYISQNIYKPFAEEQQSTNDILIADLHKGLTIQDIAPWLDIVVFINKFDFSNLHNEIFGLVYENYLKDLYGDKNKGQFFTDPAVVDFMLDELGYTPKELAKNKTKISIIDPACGAGTFLYSAVDRIVEAFEGKGTIAEAAAIKELVDKNVFGLDVAEFPLFLAEMCILLRQLPLIVNVLFNDPVEKKLKLFKTRDSISEFLGENNKETWQQFDYVIANPPYIGYNECAKQEIEFIKKIQDKKNFSITMGNVFGVNLHTVPGMPKPYAPKPNLYAFFVALGLALLKDNGKLCFVIPQTLLTAGDMDALRYHLAKKTSIEKMIIFGGNLFVDRGAETQRAVSTSSLILVATKKVPKTDHRVKIVNFVENVGRQKMSLQTYLKRRNKTVSHVQQSELAKAVENWNFIKHDETVVEWLKKYNELNVSIEEYRRNSLNDYNEVQFDKGLVFEKEKIGMDSADWLLPNKIRGCFRIGTKKDFIATKHIRIPQGSQGLKIFENKHKIIWRYMNPDRFYYSDAKIMIDFNWVIISSENKQEILFFLSVLNSKLSTYILGLYLKNTHEKAWQAGIKSIKKYIHIPTITKNNQTLKEKIVALTESMLALESVTLQDIVDFSRLNVQKFDTIYVEKNELVLSNGKEFRLKIADGKAKLVQRVIQEKYQDGGLVAAQSIALIELKTLPAIDFDKQRALNKEIDDFVFALYFDVPVKDIERHEFYRYVNS